MPRAGPSRRQGGRLVRAGVGKYLSMLESTNGPGPAQGQAAGQQVSPQPVLQVEVNGRKLGADGQAEPQGVATLATGSARQAPQWCGSTRRRVILHAGPPISRCPPQRQREHQQAPRPESACAPLRGRPHQPAMRERISSTPREHPQSQPRFPCGSVTEPWRQSGGVLSARASAARLAIGARSFRQSTSSRCFQTRRPETSAERSRHVLRRAHHRKLTRPTIASHTNTGSVSHSVVTEGAG